MNRDRIFGGAVGAATAIALLLVIGLVLRGCHADHKPAPVPPIPIPGEGLRVLVVYETADVSAYPASQAAIFTSAMVRNYLDAKCAKADGVPEFRFLDQNANMQNASPVWQQAMLVKRDSLPWVVIANGKNTFSGPLPKSVDDMLTLLRKYGG